MNPRLVVTGTDTGIGKTIFSAALAGALHACYWKPVQSGLDEATDSDTIARLAGLPSHRILPEAYRLTLPASPHLSARLDGVTIAAERLIVPEVDAPLVIEGAGGLLVPLNENLLFADLFAHWQLPTILCARTTLGTINHTLLSVEAMRARAIPLLGIVLIGAENRDSQQIIENFSHAPVLGRLPWLEEVNAAQLQRAFAENFDLSPFLEAGR